MQPSMQKSLRSEPYGHKFIPHPANRFFQENGFLYVHTPIITASDCEGAGEMFQVGVQKGLMRIATMGPKVLLG